MLLSLKVEMAFFVNFEVILPRYLVTQNGHYDTSISLGLVTMASNGCSSVLEPQQQPPSVLFSQKQPSIPHDSSICPSLNPSAEAPQETRLFRNSFDRS